jgi:ZIP family zinc transporter
MEMSYVEMGFLASLAAGLATGIGALPVLVMRKKLTPQTLSLTLGGAAGVMLAATCFSLLLPGIEAGNNFYQGQGVAIAGLAMLLGAVFFDRLDKWLPHEHFLAGPEGPSSSLRKIWLFVIAIAIHNLPEGLAVGVSFGQGDSGTSRGLATGIGLQNMPEGLAVAVALAGQGYSKTKAVIVATLTGLMEPLGGLMGAALVGYSEILLPWGLAFAAGAMLFVVSDEIIPETHAHGKSRMATFGVIIGFVLMMGLDDLFG